MHSIFGALTLFHFYFLSLLSTFLNGVYSSFRSSWFDASKSHDCKKFARVI